MPEVVGYQKRRAPTPKLLIYDVSTRVMLRPIGLDMVEVGGSILFFQDRAFWRVLARGHYRGKIAIVLPPFYLRQVAGRSQNYSQNSSR